jgi:Fe-S cluster assembly iron-binding protein IscA
MLQVTEKAVEMIKDFLKDRGEEHIIRLMMNEGG